MRGRHRGLATGRLLALCFTLLRALPTAAHELGTTQAVATFAADRSYTIEITVDPDALLTSLQIARDGRAAAASSSSERDQAITLLGAQYLAAARVAFDGVPSTPSFTYEPPLRLVEAVEAAARVRLAGLAPEGARTFTFRYDLAGGTFAMVTRVLDDPAQTTWLTPKQESAAISLAATAAPHEQWTIGMQYLTLGFTHIVPKGVDHILFVIGLFLLTTRWRPVLTQISAFTIAHSLTLALTVLGMVSLPARVVEPLIALSIAYVAIENLFASKLASWRITLVFVFGLLHGMGFASVLRELGLPRHEFTTALVSFNVGVEAGQLAVVAIAALAVGWWRSNADVYRRWVVQPASCAIAAIGLFWTVQRLVS